MELTGTQIKLIKKSWEVLSAIDPVIIGDVFYSWLFLQHPSLKKLFKPSMKDQYKKLIDMLSLIVNRLERIDEITNEITAMAIRHAEYGVKPKHYTAVGDALLWTLEHGLGNDWNPELAESWATCYSILAGAMIDVSYPKKT